jgi:structural maintenance of chromosome 4
VIEEYRRKETVYMERVAELDNITKDRDAKKKLLEDLKRKRLDNFMEGFGIITSKLKEMYQMITLGGDAELELVRMLCGYFVLSEWPGERARDLGPML